MTIIKYFSMFTGIGGFEYAIERVSQSLRPIQPQDGAEPNSNIITNKLAEWKCVGYSEINRHATAIFRYHYPNLKNYGDATKIDELGIPDFDILCGGFPCQAFSIAGQRMGFKDTRGTLFFEIARIARTTRPCFLFLENVDGLLNHDNGRTFACILTTLSELGYDAEWQVLDSQNFGVPQHRERVFIIGHLRGQCSRQVFPVGESTQDDTTKFKQKLIGNIFPSQHQAGNVYSADGVAPILLDVSHIRHEGVREYHTICPTLNTVGGGGHLPLILRDGRDNRSCLRAGRTLEVGYAGYSIRRLTPIECERLQGFPDDWTKFGIDEKGEQYIVSDSQRYKCLGNAVTTKVISAIAETITKKLFENFDATR